MDKIVDEYNNTDHCSIGKKSLDSNCFALTEKVELRHKTPKFKIGDRVRIAKDSNFLAKITIKNSQKKNFYSVLCWKLIIRCLKLKI